MTWKAWCFRTIVYGQTPRSSTTRATLLTATTNAAVRSRSLLLHTGNVWYGGPWHGSKARSCRQLAFRGLQVAPIGRVPSRSGTAYLPRARRPPGPAHGLSRGPGGWGWVPRLARGASWGILARLGPAHPLSSRRVGLHGREQRPPRQGPPVRRPHDLDNRQRPIPPPRRVLGAGRVQDQRVSELRRAGEDRPRYKPSSACDPRRTRRRVSAPDFW